MSEKDKDLLIERLYYTLASAVDAIENHDNMRVDLDDAKLLLEETKPVVEA